eukprot:TRINITY_DN13331_c0_g1_i2.p1 TRINITY_DN13331_c0_g1~~TRINITY_DN13331_c0_g1_i2.p1  ORF type:complete len:264 (-),score=21.40 TRINITY_DN13331_c0_g1_i2:46-837(-)
MVSFGRHFAHYPGWSDVGAIPTSKAEDTHGVCPHGLDLAIVDPPNLLIVKEFNNLEELCRPRFYILNNVNLPHHSGWFRDVLFAQGGWAEVMSGSSPDFKPQNSIHNEAFGKDPRSVEIIRSRAWTLLARISPEERRSTEVVPAADFLRVASKPAATILEARTPCPAARTVDTPEEDTVDTPAGSTVDTVDTPAGSTALSTVAVQSAAARTRLEPPTLTNALQDTDGIQPAAVLNDHMIGGAVGVACVLILCFCCRFVQLIRW